MKFTAEVNSVRSKKKGADLLYTVTLHTENPDVLQLGTEQDTVIVSVEKDNTLSMKEGA